MTPFMCILVVSGGLALFYELYAAIGNSVPTLSEYVWQLSKKYPLLPFAFGVLMGHFFA